MDKPDLDIKDDVESNRMEVVPFTPSKPSSQINSSMNRTGSFTKIRNQENPSGGALEEIVTDYLKNKVYNEMKKNQKEKDRIILSMMQLSTTDGDTKLG